MTLLDTPKLVGFPPAPANGGALQGAPPKVGEWVWQPKFDDRRVAIHVPTLTIYNQYGELSIADRQKEKFGAALAELQGTRWIYEWLDCGLMEYRHDMMRGCVVVFDEMNVIRPHYYRRASLKACGLEEFPIDDLARMLRMGEPIRDRVFLVNEWKDSAPLVLEGWLKATNAAIGRKFFEGLVAKRADARYPLGMKAKAKTPLWVKHRFDQP